MLVSRKSNILAAAMVMAPAAVLLIWSTSARAQYQDTTSGHVLDANNRIGSGGYNGTSTPHTDYNVNNNVVNGNVSGLNYFHGNRTQEFDPNVFQGNTGSSSFDSFNNAAAPVNYAQRNTGQPNYTPYYNTGSLVGSGPGNFVSTASGEGVIPAPVVSPLTPTGYDSRVDQTSVDPMKGNLLTPGQLNVSGPVDPSSGSPSLYSMSPLYGVRTDNQDAMFNSQTTNYRTANPADRSKLTPAQVQQMRDELNQTVVSPAAQSNSNGTNSNGQTGANQSSANQPNTGQTTPSGSANLGNSLALRTVQPQSGNLASGQALNASVNSQQLTSSLNSGQSLQNQLMIPPAKQSKQLAELEKRFAKNKTKPDDVEATQRLNQELLAQRSSAQNFDGAAQHPAKPETGSADTTGKPAPQPILTKPDLSQDNQPFVITSLANGIAAKGLADLMKTAEDQMRQGKFTEAVDTYDTSEQVAPNNPFVALGRSFAEMGAAYYGKADQDLSRAINTDPAILVGRYDLKGFLGEDRLKFVHDDLEDIANQEKGARPLVLLGFIAHNNGDDTLAAKDLAEADRRGGYADLTKLMRQAWGVK